MGIDEDSPNKIYYSTRYVDDEYEYRHVILPKQMLKILSPHLFMKDADEGKVVFRLLKEDEWRGLGICQSPGWEHFEVHVPEPHVLLFRRPRY
ncbi:regulatory subunit of cyclin-dependent kinase [Atractiella rhizophila]|nr:regulatory subunit of cyclin-dependent kinase [Atractiella rhizophila]